VRVELRGRQAGRSEVVVLGALDRPAVAAGATAALAARWAGSGRLSAGSAGLAAVDDSRAFLAELASVGIKPAVFDGAP